MFHNLATMHSMHFDRADTSDKVLYINNVACLANMDTYKELIVPVMHG